MFKNSTFFVGLELGDRHSLIYVVNGGGEVVETSRLATTKPALKRKFATFPRCRVAMEVGTHSRWASRLLPELGHEVLVANARKLRLIYANPASRTGWTPRSSPAWHGWIPSCCPRSDAAVRRRRPI